MPFLPYIVAGLLAYLLGSVPFGLLVARARGVDIRAVGSRNIGATNVFRCVGKPWGILTFALDFPNEGKETLDFLSMLDDIVTEAKGALYPAKDARMAPKMFEASFPRLNEFAEHVDPRFSSSLWRRLGGTHVR